MSASGGENRRTTISTMKQTDAKDAELMVRLTALERERAEIVAKINPLRPVQGEGTAAIERAFQKPQLIVS